MGVVSLSFEDVLKISDPSRIGPGEFIFKELSSRTIQQVVTTLYVSRLHSIPVFNLQRSNYSMFGLRDILKTVLEMVEDVDTHAPLDRNIGAQLKSTLSQKIKTNVASFLEGKKDRFVSMDSRKTLHDVVRDIIENKRSEISIITDNDVLLNVIGLDTIVRFIYINRVRMHPKYFTFNVGELELGGKERLFTINEADPVVEAFKIILAENVPCVAVLNDEKSLVGCVNLNDFQLIFKPKRTIMDLFLSAKDFIQLGKNISVGVIPPPFSAYSTCTKNTSLAELLVQAVHQRIRNFFLLDENNHITSIISLRDIVEAFFSLRLPPPRSLTKKRSF